MFKELTKEEILKIDPSISQDTLDKIEAERKKAYKQGGKDTIELLKDKIKPVKADKKA